MFLEPLWKSHKKRTNMEQVSHRNVFVVEDNEFYASLLKNELKEYCGNVTVFSSGEDCLSNISLNPDIILLDYNLSGRMNGVQVLQKIKEFNHKLPVVFLSGNYKLDVVKDAMHLGAADFLDKSDTSFSHLERLFKNIFHKKVEEIEYHINKIAKRTTIAIFGIMFMVIFFLFYFLK